MKKFIEVMKTFEEGSVMCLANARWYSFGEVSSYDDEGNPELVYLVGDDGQDYLLHVDSIEMVEEIG